jgi:hypothetical protein
MIIRSIGPYLKSKGDKMNSKDELWETLTDKEKKRHNDATHLKVLESDLERYNKLINKYQDQIESFQEIEVGEHDVEWDIINEHLKSRLSSTCYELVMTQRELQEHLDQMEY